MSQCRICGNEKGNKKHIAREMMFGRRDQFAYLECGSCGCVQIETIPENLGDYYPDDYYSFSQQSWIKRWLRKAWAKHAFCNRSLPGRLVTILHGDYQAVTALRRLRLSTSAKLLDVGCGSGQLLFDLRGIGFGNLWGADKFTPKEFRSDGITILKRDIAEVDGEFDLITTNHSFEHVSDPEKFLVSCARLLVNSGTLILRIPTASSYAWHHYGTHWVNMDPPRHLYLHTMQSIALLARQTGFVVADTIHESTLDSLLASEQYQKDIPLLAENSWIRNPLRFFWPPRRAANLRRLASELNARAEGDLVCIYLRKQS